MNGRTTWICSLGIVAAICCVDSALGQAFRPSQFSFRNNINQIIQNRPTVSPYLTLALNGSQTSTGSGANVSTYQTLVRPQLEQREQALYQQRQYQQLQQQVQNLRNDFEVKLEKNGIATGHPTRFMTHSHYYPRLDQQQTRQR